MNRYVVRARRTSAAIYDRCTGETFFCRRNVEQVRSVCRDLNAAMRSPGAERFVCDQHSQRESHA